MPSKIHLHALAYVGRHRRLTKLQERQLYDSIAYAKKNGLLSIACATKVVFLVARAERREYEYQVFVCQEPYAGRRDRHNVFALERRSGQIFVLGRELSRRYAMSLAVGGPRKKRSGG